MATNNSHHQRPSLPMSYSQNSIGSANGLSLSQSHMGSFNASQSVSSTPAPTPPGRSSQQSMSYSFTNGASQPSMQSNLGGYDGANGYGVMMPYQEEYKPQIYRVCFCPLPVISDLASRSC